LSTEKEKKKKYSSSGILASPLAVGAFRGTVITFVDFQIQNRLKKIIFITWAPQYDIGRALSNLKVKVLEVFTNTDRGPFLHVTFAFVFENKCHHK
jgi:hypothetical protein